MKPAAPAVTFGKLVGRVHDGGKDMDILLPDGTHIGLITVTYGATDIGATRRKQHHPETVEGYVEHGDLSFTVDPIQVNVGSWRDAVRAMKAKVQAQLQAKLGGAS